MQIKLTHKDVAKAAGVSTYSVSQALAGKSGVSPATRAHVLQIAKSLGYVPNAAAALLSKNRTRGLRGKIVIARLWADSSFFGQDAFHDMCANRGIDGRDIFASDFASPQALLRALWTMGVHGLYTHFYRFPWPEADLLHCSWDRFSVVKSGRLYPRLGFHLVRHSAFDYMSLALKSVLAQRYRRVAVLLRHSGSQQDDEARLGALLAIREHAAADGIVIEWRYWLSADVRDPDPHAIDWLQAFSPQAILGFNWLMLYPLIQSGWQIPRSVAFASVLGPPQDFKDPFTVAGCKLNTPEFNQRAIALLADMIGRNERGIPKLPTESVIEPVWISGESLPAIS